MDLPEWLLEQIADDERGARAAVDPERPGTHWQWVAYETDEPVSVSCIKEVLGDQDLSLRTVEEFPTPIVGDLPAFVLHSVEEGLPGGMAHIVTWDPARVLAECEAKRQIVEAWQSTLEVVDDDPDLPEEDRRGYRDVATGLGDAVRLLALPLADRPGYLDEWRP